MPEVSRNRRLIQVTSAAVVLIVVGAGATVALNRTGSSSDRYRTIAVSRGPVRQSLTLVGTAQRVSQVTAGLASAGTVSTVRAVVGQRVTAGQALATLDPADLHESLLAAQATLAKAEASLAADQAAATSPITTSTSSSATTGTAAAFGPGTGSTASAGPVSSTAAYVSAASPNASKPGSTATAKPGPAGTRGHAGGSSTRGTKLGSVDLTALGAAISGAEAALAAQQTACAPVLGSPSPAHGSGHTTAAPSSYRTAGSPDTPSAPPSLTGTPAPGPSAGQTSTPTVPPSSGTSGPTGGSTPAGPTSAQIQTCVTALQATAQAQQKAQAAFSQADTALAAAVKTVEQAATTAAAAGQQSGSHGTGSTKGASGAAGGQSSTRSGTTGSAKSGQPSGATGASGASGGGSSAGAGESPATRVASDQVSVLQAQASVSQAKAALDQVTLTAPIAGVVASVSVVAGQPAAAGAGFVIVGSGAAQVTAQVPLADMPVVTKGLSAAVLPAGSATPTPGSVESVGLLPASSTSGTTTFPATILVASPPVSMAGGASVSVAITTRTVPDAIRVPVSALSGVDTDRGSVSVLSADAVTTNQVVVGAVGGGWAQVSSGLAVGDQVVIADVTAALPTNTTNGLRGLGGGAGGGSFRRAGTTGGAASGAAGGASSG